MEIFNTISFDINQAEFAKRKERITRIFDYLRVDHIPVGIFVWDNREDFSIKEMVLEKEKNLKFDLNCIKSSLEIFPDDYIPFLKPESGSTVLASILGSEIDFGSDPMDYPRVKEPLISTIDVIDTIKFPSSKKDIALKGLMPLNLEKIRYYREITKGIIDITGYDLGGALITAEELMDTQLFYMSLLSDEEKMLPFIGRIGDIHAASMEMVVKEAGSWIG